MHIKAIHSKVIFNQFIEMLFIYLMNHIKIKQSQNQAKHNTD
jgi:hypothetical protein